MAMSEGYDFFIQWHLTERCNLSCTHCYQEGRSGDQLSLTEIREVIDEVSTMIDDWQEAYDIAFSTTFNVTGGEPFLRGDLFQILEAISRKGFDIYLLSNGTVITRERARALAALGIKGVQVSMEGPEDIHERIRGRGSFSSALGGVRNLLDEGIKVALNTTLSEVNADHFMEMVTTAADLGVPRLGFSRLVPSGRGMGMLDRMLTAERIKVLYERIFSLEVQGLDIVTGDPVASQMSSQVDEDETASVPVGGCAAGVSGLTLLPDGTITPCRRLNIPLGNVRQDALREIWATSPVLESLRDRSRYRGKCGRCPRWARCRGCRAIAYAYAISRGNRDFLAEDPQCFIEEY